MAKYETTVIAKDATAPVATDIKFVNNTTDNRSIVDIFFSEPVNLNSGSAFVVTDSSELLGATLLVNNALSFAKFTSIPAENKVRVEFFNKLADGEQTISIVGVKDYANLSSAAFSKAITVSTDTTAPVALSVSAVVNKVTVTFNEAMSATQNNVVVTVTEVGSLTNRASTVVGVGNTVVLQQENISIRTPLYKEGRFFFMLSKRSILRCM